MLCKRGLCCHAMSVCPSVCLSVLLVENRHFFQTPLHSTPPLGGFLSEYRHPVWHEKTRMAWLSDGEKNFEDIFIRFGATHERDRRTARHRMPAIAPLMHSIAQQK